jgi:hypothetical protein
MSLRNNKKNPPKADKKQKKAKKTFVDVLRDDDFSEYVEFLKSPWKTFSFNFLRGTGFGLGTILGTAIVLALLVYIFGLLTGVPILGDWLNRIFGNIKI